VIAALLFSITIDADFEGGRAGRVERAGETALRVALPGESDQDGRNRQITWYYFRVDGIAGRPFTIHLTDLTGEYNYKPARPAIDKRTPGVYSLDNKVWRHFTAEQWSEPEPGVVRIRFDPNAGSVYLAHVPPYTTEHLAELLRSAASHPHLRRDVIGKTVQGRDIPLLTITDPAVTESSKKVVWLMFRQHSWEAGSSWTGEGAIRHLLAAEAAPLRRQFVFKVLPMCDPDGVARGGVRFNLHGYDLNRNWDLVIPGKMPEIAAQKKAVYDWLDAGKRIDLFFTLHNTETSEYLDGPNAERLYEILRSGTSFNPTRPPQPLGTSTTPGKPGRMNVCQALHQERKIPCMLMEQAIAQNTKLGRQPSTGDRQRFGRELVEAIGKWLAP
jgi:hypothetical protein